MRTPVVVVVVMGTILVAAGCVAANDDVDAIEAEALRKLAEEYRSKMKFEVSTGDTSFVLSPGKQMGPQQLSFSKEPTIPPSGSLCKVLNGAEVDKRFFVEANGGGPTLQEGLAMIAKAKAEKDTARLADKFLEPMVGGLVGGFGRLVPARWLGECQPPGSFHLSDNDPNAVELYYRHNTFGTEGKTAEDFVGASGDDEL